MSDLTEQIASVLDLIPTELQDMPNDLIGLLIRAKAEIDELEISDVHDKWVSAMALIDDLEKTLEQQRWANLMLNAANIDLRKKIVELSEVSEVSE